MTVSLYKYMKRPHHKAARAGVRDRSFPCPSHFPETRADSKTLPSVRTVNFRFAHKLHFILSYFTRWTYVRTCKEPVGSLAF